MSTELGQVDPNVRIPAAVRAAAAHAEAIQKQSIAPVEETPADVPAPDIETIVNGEQPAPKDGVQPAPKEGVKRDESNDEHPDETWKNKYLSMKGRFDRAQNDISNMSSTITALQRSVNELKEQVTQPVTTQRERLITDEEETEYGKEFLDVVAKKAREDLSPEFVAMKKELEKLKKNFNSVTESNTQTAREQLFNTLDQRLPQWQNLNENQDFITWLRLPDTYSGVIRHELLNAAFERNNATQVMAFFNGFLAEEAAVAPAGTHGAEFSGAQAPQDKLSLEEFAAPGRAKTAAASAPTEKPFFNRSQISQFYAAVTAGRYRGREAEQQKLEAQIFEAQREGRIRDR